MLQVFHAGTARDTEGNIVAAGGRVLGISATGKTVLEAQQKAYEVTVSLASLFCVSDVHHAQCQTNMRCSRLSLRIFCIWLLSTHPLNIESACSEDVLCLPVLLAKVLQDVRPAMQAVDVINWPEGFVRRDIGWRATDRTS